MKNQYSHANNVHELRTLSDPQDELSAFRQMLLGPTLKQQSLLEERIDSLTEQLDELAVRSGDCSSILPRSIDKLHANNQTLTSELEPEISAGVDKCFKEQPEKMAEALYPVLGPAVRKLVASLFTAGEQSHAKAYEVEQIFLIHRETSLVLSHSIMHEGVERDPDLVSGMLDAIRSFVQDAFALSEFDGMNSIELGELTVWVEWGPKAILAVVVRGFADAAVKDQYAETLRQIHVQYGSELDSFTGDAQALSGLDIAAISEQCGVETKQTKQTTPSGPLFTTTRLMVIIVLSMLALNHTVSHNRNWSRTLSALHKESGVVVVSEDSNVFSTSQLVVLRDPRAATREVIIERARIDLKDVSVQWHPFQSADPLLPTLQVNKFLMFENMENGQRGNSQTSVKSEVN